MHSQTKQEKLKYITTAEPHQQIECNIVTL